MTSADVSLESYNIALLQSQELRQTFIFVDTVVVGDNAFAINSSLPVSFSQEWRVRLD